jgi:hypothetical protein
MAKEKRQRGKTENYGSGLLAGSLVGYWFLGILFRLCMSASENVLYKVHMCCVTVCVCVWLATALFFPSLLSK